MTLESAARDAAARGVKLLIVGASSFVAKPLWLRVREYGSIGTFFRHPLHGTEPFVLGKDSITPILNIHPGLTHAVISSAIAQPDRCCADPSYSYEVNVTATLALIELLLARGVVPIFLSTAGIFDGNKGNYVETDLPSPLMLYAKQKREVENYLIHHALESSIIVRLGRVFGIDKDDGTIFTDYLTKIMADQEIRYAADQAFTVIHREEVGEAILKLILHDCRGIFHIGGDERLTRLDCISLMLRIVGLESRFMGRLHPVLLESMPTLEPRPRDTSLSIAKLIEKTGFRPTAIQHWGERLVERSQQEKWYES